LSSLAVAVLSEYSSYRPPYAGDGFFATLAVGVFDDFFAVKGGLDDRCCSAFPGGENTYVGVFLVEIPAEGCRGVESIVVGGAKWNSMSSGSAGESSFLSGDEADWMRSENTPLD
jgi:hypothetical protein